MAAALRLRERFPGLPISEAHPKALLWLLGIDGSKDWAPSLGFEALAGHLDWPAAKEERKSEHERDAALATLSAHAALHEPAGWCDLAALDPDATALSPLSPPRGYWMPLPALASPESARA